MTPCPTVIGELFIVLEEFPPPSPTSRLAQLSILNDRQAAGPITGHDDVLWADLASLFHQAIHKKAWCPKLSKIRVLGSHTFFLSLTHTHMQIKSFVIIIKSNLSIYLSSCLSVCLSVCLSGAAGQVFKIKNHFQRIWNKEFCQMLHHCNIRG